MSAHRRSCYCPSCQDWLMNNENDYRFYVPFEDRDKEFCFIFLKEHREQFIGDNVTILVTSGHTRHDDKDNFKIRCDNGFSSYMGVGYWESYRYNKEFYVQLYNKEFYTKLHDEKYPCSDKKIKSSIFYHISIIFPEKNFVYTHLSVLGMGGLRKIISNTKRLTKTKPSIIMKQSRNKNIGGYENHDLEQDKLYKKFEMKEPTVSCWL